MPTKKKPHSFKIAKTTKRVKPKAKPKPKPAESSETRVRKALTSCLTELQDATTRAEVAEKRLHEVKLYLTRNILMSNIARQALEILKGE